MSEKEIFAECNENLMEEIAKFIEKRNPNLRFVLVTAEEYSENEWFSNSNYRVCAESTDILTRRGINSLNKINEIGTEEETEVGVEKETKNSFIN